MKTKRRSFIKTNTVADIGFLILHAEDGWLINPFLH